MAHTPGAYYVEDEADGSAYAIKHSPQYRACVKTDASDAVLCDVRLSDYADSRSSEEAYANACLFAAASDLLAACEAAINMDWHGIGAPHMYEQLRAAIAKARDEQPATE